jgi:TolB-like protein/lipoprotein NlpI
VGIAYAVIGWLLMQITETLAPALRLPEWFPTAVAFLFLLGLPLALFFSWAYELTPDGIRRESEIDQEQSIRPQTARKLDRMIIMVLIAVVAVLLIDRFWSGKEEQSKVDSTPNTESADEAVVSKREKLELQSPNSKVDTGDVQISVAVLPFVNMSDDEENEYFSDGISEELLNVLVSIENLRVPSRTSSFTFKGSDRKITDIGRELQVDHVLEGSVRKSGNRIRVTAQLIDISDDTQLWSETYTRELNDVFAVQEEIALAIVETLKVTLSVGDQEKLADHLTDNLDAYNKYLLGRYLWNQRTAHSLLAAVDELKQCIELDAEFDQAWAALADTYLIIPEYQAGTVENFIPLAREAVARALEINPASARALTVSATIKGQYDFNWNEAISDFEKAIETEPGYATAHQWFGDILISQGRLDEALEQLKLAAVADPLSAVVRHTPGYFLLYSNRLDEAEAQYLYTLELDPHFRWTHQNLDILYTLMGDYDKARVHARYLAQIEGFDPSADLARIDAVENPKLKPRAMELLGQRTDLPEGVWGMALQYVLLGEDELALESLEKAFEIGSPWAIHMNWVFLYEPFHHDPRFLAMLEKMNQLP